MEFGLAWLITMTVFSPLPPAKTLEGRIPNVETKTAIMNRNK
jgi:hypothetical protein